MWPNLQETADLVTFTEDSFSILKISALNSGGRIATQHKFRKWRDPVQTSIWWSIPSLIQLDSFNKSSESASLVTEALETFKKHPLNTSLPLFHSPFPALLPIQPTHRIITAILTNNQIPLLIPLFQPFSQLRLRRESNDCRYFDLSLSYRSIDRHKLDQCNYIGDNVKAKLKWSEHKKTGITLLAITNSLSLSLGKLIYCKKHSVKKIIAIRMANHPIHPLPGPLPITINYMNHWYHKNR